MADADEHPSYELGALSQKVAGLEVGFRNLGSQLDGISKQVAEIARGRPQNMTALVTTVATVAALVGSLFYAFLSPMAKDIGEDGKAITKVMDTFARLDILREDEKKQAQVDSALLERIDRLGDNKLSKETHSAYEKATDRRFEDLEKMATLLDTKMGERVTELEATIKTRLDWSASSIGNIQHDLVTRPENAAHWEEEASALASSNAAQSERSSAIVSSLNELRRQFYEAFNSGDAMKDVLARLREVEAERHGVTSPAQIAPLTPIGPLEPIAPVAPVLPIAPAK